MSKKKKSIFVLVVLPVLLVAAAYAIYKHHKDDEIKVYVAFFNDPFIDTVVDKGPFVSIVSMCGLELLDLDGDAELYESMKIANGSTANPISLTELGTHTNVTGDSITDEHQEGETSSAANNTQVRGLSRVGFNKMKDKAVFCIESEHSASVVISSKKSFGNWRIYQSRLLWIK